MKIGNRSFPTRLSFNIVLIVSNLFVVALIIIALSTHSIIADEATEKAEQIMKATVAELEGNLKQVESTLKGASWIVAEHRDDTAFVKALPEKILLLNPHIVGATIAYVPDYFAGRHFFSPYATIDTNGVLSTFQLGNDSYDYFVKDWFKVPYETRCPAWSEPYFDEGGGEQMMSTYSMPLFDEDGNVYAVITADISLRWTSDLVKAIKPYEHSSATLLSAGGHFIGADNIERLTGLTIYEALEKANLTSNEKVRKAVDSMLSGESGTLRYTLKSQVAFMVFGSLHNNWHLSISCEYRDVLKRSTELHILLIIIGLVGLAIIFYACYRRIRSLTKPITELTVAAKNMGKANFHTTLPDVETKDEMFHLRNSFAYMQESINDYISELRSTTASNERMEGELNIARKIQLGMLLHEFPAHVGAMLTAAKEVGGDLYDFYEVNNKLYFTVGDVSGKGVPAALYMAITRAAFRFLARTGCAVDTLVSRINESLSNGNEQNMFCTLFVGCIDLTTGEMHYCNAGHNPIIVIPPACADGSCEPYYLRALPNLATGLFGDFEYKSEQLQLARGSRLLLYTDGVSEAETAKKELFGDDRLLATVRSLATTTSQPKELVEGLYAEVKKFTGDNEQNDDITILSVNV